VDTFVTTRDSKQEKGNTKSFEKVNAINKETEKRRRGRPQKIPKNNISPAPNQPEQPKSSSRKKKKA
jgi:hypothetical protein